MAIWKLSGRVWWGGWTSPHESMAEAKSILCVADRPSMCVSVWNGRGKPVWWLGVDDEHTATGMDATYLRSVAHVAMTHNLFPMLVYCNGGQNRSPTTAAVIESLISGRKFDEVWGDVQKLRSNAGRNGETTYSNYFRTISGYFR